MASALNWIPDSLYNYSISALVSYRPGFFKDFPSLPNNVLFDVCYKLYTQGLLNQLRRLFSDINIFYRLVQEKGRPHLLHHSFQALVDQGYNIANVIVVAYKFLAVKATHGSANLNNTIEMGFEVGVFLSDAGWFLQSDNIFWFCLCLSKTLKKKEHSKLRLDAYQCLLHVRNSYCSFNSAEKIYREALAFVAEMQSAGQFFNLAGLYGEISCFFLCQSNYNEAYKWSVEALKEIHTCTVQRVTLSVLKQAAKVCVLKKEFRRAELLMKQALYLASQFGNRHPVMADFLIDYGFYLMNVDSVNQSSKVYQTALEIRQFIFGGTNLLVAIAHQDLAYSLYVHEYSAGKFKDAREHVERATYLMTQHLPADHLLLASLKRVKALILEEIAIDTFDHDKFAKLRLFHESQELHLSALNLVKGAFGEMNVRTAKHYGNVGRLYQSMHRFAESKEMHLKAIKIKERLLGPEDHEVALSLGHLASLYNYHMGELTLAEPLYLRSINICVKLFGESYSGLEYDYRGLFRIYIAQGNDQKANEYVEMLSRWKSLRNKIAEVQNGISPLTLDFEPLCQSDIYQTFLRSV